MNDSNITMFVHVDSDEYRQCLTKINNKRRFRGHKFTQPGSKKSNRRVEQYLTELYQVDVMVTNSHEFDTHPMETTVYPRLMSS